MVYFIKEEHYGNNNLLNYQTLITININKHLQYFITNRVNWASSRYHMNDMVVSKSKPSSSQVLVSFISKKADYLVSEELLRSVFDHFGTVVDVTIKKTSIDSVSI